MAIIIQIHQDVYSNTIEMNHFQMLMALLLIFLLLIITVLRLCKQKITGETADGGTKNVGNMVPLKYLSNSWGTLEMPLINCEINLILTWCDKCVLSHYTKNNNIYNNWFKTLCSSCNFINSVVIDSVQFISCNSITITTIEIGFQKNN